MRREDLTGQMFGNWLALEYAGDRKWLCECQCELHTRRAVTTTTLKSGKSTSCGLCNKIHYDLTNMQFGELKVLRYTGKDNKWLCKCSCGAIVEKTSKHLRNNVCKTCGNQHQSNLDKLQSAKKIQYKPKTTQSNNSEPKTFGDWTALKKVDDRRYLCECVCGYRKEMSDSSLWNAKKNGYTCSHVKILGRKFGYLEVLERRTQKQCVCKCHACGKTVIVALGNLLNGSYLSCGCIKATPTYTKEQILAVIQKYTEEHNGIKPQPLELKDILGLSETATYENIKRYGLESYLDRHSSIGEKQVADIFKDCNVIKHDRKVLNGLELDIYLPDLKLAVEYNGSFWHSDDIKDKFYHQHKTITCARQGIHLIHIFDYEWNDPVKRNKLTNYLKSFITKREQYQARTLQVHEIESNRANEFCDKYHLQNHVNSSVNIALTKDNEVISLMSFSSPRFNSGYQWELTRYCTKDGVGVTGGAEKLLSFFKNNYNPQSIITYTDISKFTGNVYTRLGFKPTDDCITKPNYVWVDNHLNILQRYNTQKHKLLEKGHGTADQTEDEIMYSHGYTKVYDSGNLRLEWLNNNI